MTEDTKVEANDEIDLIDLFVVLLKHRFLIIVPILIVILLTAIGYFIIPQSSFSKNEQDKMSYTKANMSLSMHTFVAQYINDKNKILYSNDQNDLIVNDTLYKLFLDTNFLAKSITESGNVNILLGDEDPSDIITSVKPHINPKKTTIEDTDWLYQVIKKPYSIEITTYFRDLDKIQTNDFLLTLQQNANNAILGHIKPSAIDRISNYQDYLKIETIENAPDDILYDYISALGIVRGDFIPLIIVDGPVVEEVAQTQSLSEHKKEYIKKAVIATFALFFLLIFLAFLLEFIQNLKNDKERYDKIKNALRK